MKLKKAYQSWMISYLIIICVAFFCSVSIYLVIGNVVKQEVDRSNAVILENVRLNMDSYIGDMQKIASDIGSAGMFDPLVGGEMTEREFALWTTKMQSELSRYQNINTNIETIYFYVKDRDYVVSPNRAVPAEIMYEIVYREAGISQEEWKNMLLGSRKNGFRQIPAVSPSGEVQQELALMRPFPAMEQEPEVVLVLSVRGDRMSRTMEQGGFSEDSRMFLLNANDEVVLSDTGKTLPVQYDALRDGQQLKIRAEGESYVVTSARSSAMRMRYVLGIPNSSYYKTAIVVRNIAFAGVFFFLAVALFAAYRLLKNNYKPLRELMGYVDKAYGGAAEEENEYRVFQNAISKAVSEKAQMQSKLRQQSRSVKDHMLQNLLKGKVDQQFQIEDIMFSFGVDFNEPHFVVLVFYVEFFDELFEGSNKEVEEQASLAVLVVRNITKELLDRKFETVFVETDDMMVCLLNTAEQDSGRVTAAVRETVGEAKKVIKENFYIDFTVSVSGVHETAKGIAEAYQEAMEAMDYKMIVGSGGIICHDELEVSEDNYYYPIETELMLMNAVKAGEEEKAKELLEELFFHNFEKKRLSLEMAKCFISNVVSTVLKVLEDIRLQTHADLAVETEELGRILGGMDVEETKQELLDIIGRICVRAAQERNTSTQKIAGNVKAYVQKNYMDFNLSLHSIADELGITHTYLSRVFKMETGEGLLQFINKVRLEEAKRLLRETDQSIVQIAEAVGYGNSNSLIRSFKKYNGITPGRYRELEK